MLTGTTFLIIKRIDKSHNREAGGSGLGLAIVKRVVELHGGRVEIDSAAGKGTAVTVFLPAM
ncbi:ATP-binding protein [Paenibacillus nasutitermitis]|uniref:ATP-binding protein n=1 Tax=Paenibacillus nasutitermitis TaxID=1652958 RepID=UPI0016680734|nr:ATP-binding protein [Paenibacillus nasutitermitis]